MLAKELISEIVTPIKTSTTGTEAIGLMDDIRVSHIPIVNNQEFLGLISDEDILAMEEMNDAIGSSALSLFSPYVYDYQHVYEVIELASRMKLSLVPVLNESKQYLGSITLPDLLQLFAAITASDQPGGILVFSMTYRDYSLSEIARLVEENDAKIISLYVGAQKDTTEIDVTIKLNVFDLTSIIRNFERFGYNIKATYRDSENLESLYRDRFDEFMRYLNT